ncbi:MAG: FMN-binding protein [Actinobacteria bacterium]|nr:FMN-binding protein [Actinomycetota bacterium]
MRRAILVTAGTAAGLAAVLTYTPRPAESAALPIALPAAPAAPSAAAAPATPVDATADAPASVPTPAPTPTPTVASAQSYVGPVIETAFGPVQVEVTVEGGTITAANALQVPSADPKSIKIGRKAIPQLQQETLVAQSADVAVVSGASYTSDGWKQSLAGALSQLPADSASSIVASS